MNAETQPINHTPGPWVQNPGPDGGSEDHKRANRLYVRLGCGSANAIVERKNVFGKVSDEDLANARLIAAAPDLLYALQELLALVQGECPSLLEDDHHFDIVTDAIQKAKGIL